MRFHGFIVGAALASALAFPARAEDEVLDAAQFAAPVGQTAPAALGESGQLAPLPAVSAGQLGPVVIDLQGLGADGSPAAAQATLTPLPDGRVQVQQTIPNATGGTTLQSGVGTIQGNELRADLRPVVAQGGLTSVITDGPTDLQAAPLPVVISVDPSGAVQSQSPQYQGRAQDRSHKVRDFFRNAGQKTKNFFVSAGQKTKGFFGRIGAFFKNMFAKIKSFFSRKKAQQADVAPTPIQDLPAIQPTPIQGPPASLPPALLPIDQLPSASDLPALGEEAPLTHSQAAAG